MTAGCPTCSGPVRATVGMVCPTCGTDYARPLPSAVEGLLTELESLRPGSVLEVTAAGRVPALWARIESPHRVGRWIRLDGDPAAWTRSAAPRVFGTSTPLRPVMWSHDLVSAESVRVLYRATARPVGGGS